MRLASMPVILDNIDKLPRTGWSALRELSKLGEPALRSLFARGAIGPARRPRSDRRAAHGADVQERRPASSRRGRERRDGR